MRRSNTLQFESIAVHPTDRNLMIGGTQDNGTEYQQTSGGIGATPKVATAATP